MKARRGNQARFYLESLLEAKATKSTEGESILATGSTRVSTSAVLNLVETEEKSMDESTNTTAGTEPKQSFSAEDFQAIEQKIHRAVEIVRREREARAAAEAEAASLREQLDALIGASNETQTQLTTLNQEREVVRSRVEKLMRQMDELI